MSITATRARAELLADKRAHIEAKREGLLTEVNARADSTLTEPEEQMVASFRSQVEQIDEELGQLTGDLEREEKAAEQSKLLRGHLAATAPGFEPDGDGKGVYRTFAAYARDKIITENQEAREIVERTLGHQAVTDAHDRLMRMQSLMRAPEHTLSSDVGGLLPPTHISQIMDIIDSSRPVIASANRVDLSSGSLTWPKVTQRPLVRYQGTEKTEPNTRKMTVDMKSAAADTYIGAGNLSWQAVNWSDPSAMDLFFRLCAEQYAIATEASACHVLQVAAATISAGSLTGDGTDTFEDWLTAVVAGFAQIYDATRAVPNTLYLSPDMFFFGAVVTSDSRTVLIDVGSLDLPGLSGRMASLRLVTSPGFDATTAIVGDSRALLVGETPGAPVRLQVVEPSIGGYEVGVIGAFKAISFDDNRFADIGAST